MNATQLAGLLRFAEIALIPPFKARQLEEGGEHTAVIISGVTLTTMPPDEEAAYRTATQTTDNPVPADFKVFALTVVFLSEDGGEPVHLINPFAVPQEMTWLELVDQLGQYPDPDAE